MQFKRLAAALLALLPAPALADVTAHYTAKDQSLTIEADDHGNVRLTVADKFTLIRRDGVDYAVIRIPAGTDLVVRADDVLKMIAAQMQGAHPPTSAATPKLDFTLAQGSDETVAGHAGTVWNFGPAPPDAQAGDSAKGAPAARDRFDIVMSSDPALAPVGGFLRHLFDTVAPMFLSTFGDSNFVQRVDELFAHGAPVRIGPVLTLTAVETTPIAADHFVLPAPVMSADAFFEAVHPSKPAQALPPAP